MNNEAEDRTRTQLPGFTRRYVDARAHKPQIFQPVAVIDMFGNTSEDRTVHWDGQRWRMHDIREETFARLSFVVGWRPAQVLLTPLELGIMLQLRAYVTRR